MTNKERILARISRDKERRKQKKLARSEKYGRIKKVITNQNLFRSLMKRRKGTDWKQSVMDYLFHAIVKNKRQKDAVLAGALPEPNRIKKISLYERGKRRDVHAVAIDSRVLQGVLCDDSITPLTQPGLIHDNPASTKGKGVTWERRRILRFIRRQIRKTGKDSYAFIFDLRHFFDSIRHSLCKGIFHGVNMDEMLISLAMHFIRMYQIFEARASHNKEKINLLLQGKGVGVSLGSQISQDMALAAPNKLDHYIKDVVGIKHFIRYMDDGYASGTKAEMTALQKGVADVARSLGFILHETKSHVVKMSRGFTYLKIRYVPTETGHIIRRLSRAGIVRMRRKLKRLNGLVNQGRVTKDDVFLSVKSWLGNAKKYAHSYRTRKRILSLYRELFGNYRMRGVIA